MTNTEPTELDDLLGFLLGENELDGYWFGDTPKDRAKFWWRKKLRAINKSYISRKAVERARLDEGEIIVSTLQERADHITPNLLLNEAVNIQWERKATLTQTKDKE